MEFQMEESLYNKKDNLLSTVSISLTIVYCILFPADKLNIKEIILCLTLFVSSPIILKYLKAPNNTRLLFWGIVYPIWVTVLSIIIGDSSLGSALSYGYVWIYLLLLPPIVELNIDIKRPFILATFIVAIIVDFIFLTDMLGVISIYSNPLISFFSDMNEMQWGKGVLATFGYSIFYKSSPLIIITFGYMLFNKKYLLAGVLFLSLAATGTRANLLIAIAILVIIPIFCSDSKPTQKMVIGFILLGAALYIAPLLLERLAVLNQLKYSRSEDVKIKAIYSIFEYMNEEPSRYLFGSGVGSYFYSTGRNAYVNVVEVSFFDYFRQVGIFNFVLFLCFLLRPIKKLYTNQKWLLVCYIGYMAIAFTNPLLVTSTSFMLYILVLSNGMGDKRESLL